MYSTCYGNGSAASPALTNATFIGNAASGGSGGGMYNSAITSTCTSYPTLTNVTFSGNSTGIQGGGLTNSGFSNTTLTNVTFSGNSASGDGGAMFNYNASSVTLINVILWGDTAISGSQNEIVNIGATPTIDHSIVKGGCPSGSTCTNLLTADPVLGALAYYGGFTPTFLPGAGSAAIDAGSNAGCPATDQRGVRRPQGAYCDIGSVEVVTDRIFADNFDGTPTP
jgi:predicted outer membrane repeat protein